MKAYLYRKKQIFFIFFFLFFLFFSVPSFAADVPIWTGWASCESGPEGGRSAGSDGGHAFGLFQFDDRYESLYKFMQYCMSEDPELYGGFSYYYDKYKSMQSPYIAGSPDLSGMISTWHRAYDADPDRFVGLQLDIYQQDYYAPVVEMCRRRRIDLEDTDRYSPVLRGTLWSISIWAGPTIRGVGQVISKLNASMTEEEMLDICYSEHTAFLKGSSGKYIKAFKERWMVTQKGMATQALVKWKSGLDIATTESGDLSLMFASAGRTYGIDGGVYVDYIQNWISKYPELSTLFKESGGWNADNKEWCNSLRTAGDFYEMYGILGGGLELDFSIGTSGGYVIGDVNINASLFEIPDNGGSMPIPYYSQGSGAPWAGDAFGGGNIASSGCSITSLAMVISYLNGGTDKDGWTFPSDVVSMIQQRTGNYNHFYVGDSGQSWSIMPAVAGYYDIKCESIGSSSIVASLASGRPVIMSCKPGEFTKKGHFIVLSGITEDGYIVVNDPAHPDKSYKKYPASFIAGQGKAWWSFSR